MVAFVTLARQDGKTNLLLAYWKSREDYQRNEQAFSAIHGARKIEGFLRNPGESWLARAGRMVSYNTILLTLVAILGALQ